jgi:DNA-binding PadR family transcriptional regulator
MRLGLCHVTPPPAIPLGVAVTVARPAHIIYNVNINNVIKETAVTDPASSTKDRLGEFEQLALLSVLQLGGEAYGGQILEQLEGRAERSASLSSVYITLTRLEKKGLVSSRMGDPTEERGGKAKRFFRVEPAGIEALQESRDRLLRMWTGLEEVLDGGLATRGA